MPAAKYVDLIPSPNGQFIYYLANPTYYSGHQKLYVFDTDATVSREVPRFRRPMQTS